MKRRSIFNLADVEPVAEVEAVEERFAHDLYGTHAPGQIDRGRLDDCDFQQDHQGGGIDAAAGLLHFRYRELNPALMRWMPQDPVGYVEGHEAY